MTARINRRETITLLSGAAVWPLAARAQRGVRRIGRLDTRPGVPSRDYIDGFRLGLAEIGFVEGRDVTVEDGHLEWLPSLADDLVRRRVAVIFANLMTEAVMVLWIVRPVVAPAVLICGYL